MRIMCSLCKHRDSQQSQEGCLGLWLTCIVELRLGAAAVDDHRFMQLLGHGHAEGRHGAFVNEALKTGHTQKPATRTQVLFHKRYCRIGGRKQMRSALGGGSENVISGLLWKRFPPCKTLLYLLMSLFVFSSDSLTSTGV